MNIVRVTSLKRNCSPPPRCSPAAQPRGAGGWACSARPAARAASSPTRPARFGISIPDLPGDRGGDRRGAAAVRQRAQPAGRDRVRRARQPRRAEPRARPSTSRSTPRADDPNLDFILYTGLTLPASAAGRGHGNDDGVQARLVPGTVASSPIPVIPVSSTCVDLAGYGREQPASRGLYLLPGLNGSIEAISNALRWAENRGSRWSRRGRRGGSGNGEGNRHRYGAMV